MYIYLTYSITSIPVWYCICTEYCKIWMYVYIKIRNPFIRTRSRWVPEIHEFQVYVVLHWQYNIIYVSSLYFTYN